MRARSIIVDADACPVKSEIEQAGRQFGVQVVLVASFDHRMKENPGVKVVQVDRSDQSVDLYIANQIQQGDILVTQDFGLAALGLAKGSICLTNRGQEYTDSSIDFLLDRRHVSAKMRRSGKHSKGPKPFTEADRQNFLHGLTKLLKKLQEIENK
ncbi:MULTISPECIES: YaiI/YqxD family protein [Paenibacillus]|uniref:YaiI/YqxD family protein n=1 Tax=Paenibacillus TaxID=44249 RepID=UPI0007032A2C|nr:MULTISPECIES: YaiI/YqxD family protein [Paenibacillus]KRF28091.1 hypothetical protein ASG93_28940 [Paenibacillus sp. Soil787]NRF91828.1 YaiI/YqxD family protein [Paenibacillus frigoriresistens]